MQKLKNHYPQRYVLLKKSAQDANDDIIKTKLVYKPHNKNMLDKNATVDDDSRYFETPRKNNHSATATSYQVLLVSDTLKCKHNTTTQMV